MEAGVARAAKSFIYNKKSGTKLLNNEKHVDSMEKPCIFFSFVLKYRLSLIRKIISKESFTMPRIRRLSKAEAIALRILILVIVTVIMIRITVNRLAETAQDSAYPSAQKLYAQQSEEKGKLRALRDVYSADAADEPADESSKDSAAIVTPATITLESPALAQENAEPPATELIDVNRAVFRGKLLRISDPSRVFVGVSGPLGDGYSGKHLIDMVKDYGAIAGTNASGFDDPNGMGSGGVPLGIVISEGELCYGSLYGNYEVIGFDKDDKLHCEWMTGQQAMDIGIRDAACFGPILISNGERVYNGGWVNYNPRTVLGQTEDGTVLILVIEGRQCSSIGATYEEVTQLMLDLGAVNAGNMDGGASSEMIYEGEQITISSSLYGARLLPTGWMVKPES